MHLQLYMFKQKHNVDIVNNRNIFTTRMRLFYILPLNLIVKNIKSMSSIKVQFCGIL